MILILSRQDNKIQYKWYAGLSKGSTLDRTSSTLARISRDCLCCLAPALLCILSSHPEAFFRSRSLSWQVPRVSLLKGGPIQAYGFVKWNSPKSCQLQLSPLKPVCIQIMLFFSSFDFNLLRSNICISSNQRRRRLAEMTAGGRSNILDPARRCLVGTWSLWHTSTFQRVWIDTL